MRLKRSRGERKRRQKTMIKGREWKVSRGEVGEKCEEWAGEGYTLLTPETVCII